MAIPNSITCFYTSVGSRDFPVNHGWNEPFGFNENSTVPIYNYSLLDIRNAMISSREIMVNNPMRPNENSLLIVNTTGNESFYEAINPYESFWTKIFKMIDCVFANPSKYASMTGDRYYADRVFSGDENDPAYIEPLNVSSAYVTGTFIPHLNNTPGSNRITHFSFSVIEPDNSVTISIMCYVDSTYFIEKVDGNQLVKVYTYEDEDGNFEINSEEFKNQIVVKILNILKDGKYKRVDKYSTRRFYEQTETEASYVVMKDFYVFSNILEGVTISAEFKKKAIIAYLNDIHSDRLEKLQIWYPDLYSVNTVEIRPMYTHNSTETLGGVKKVHHPLSGEALIKFLTSKGIIYDYQANNYKPFEIFYVGSSVDNAYIYRWPIVAVEASSSSAIRRPISDRFKNYLPKWGDSEENLGTDEDTFHYLLLLGLNIAIDPSSSVSNIPQEFSSMDWNHNTTENRVTFVYKNVVWEIYGPTINEAL